MTAWLAGFAVVFIVVVLVVFGRTGGTEVTVGLAQVVGGRAGSALGITANGYVVARTQASVSSKISGRLAYLGVEEGSVVRRGEVIASLENDDYRAMVAQAEAEVTRSQATLAEGEAQRDQLRRDLRRARELLSDSLISQQEVEDLTARLDAADARVGAQQAQVQVANAALGVARANLENTYIRAAFDGTVLRKDAEVGEVVAPVATGGGLTRGAVVTMADLETLEVEVDVNEAYIAQIEGGQPTLITLDAYPDTTYRGAVRQIVPTADRQRATVLVKVSILDRDPRILPEMGARVDFLQVAETGIAEPPQSRVFIPAAAVRDEQGQPVVWVVRDGRVWRVPVSAGPVSGGRREIRSGLIGGEQVVVAGPAVLDHGATVRVVPQ
ncbi:MAG: efflux RND transporter periplasmic adaptor subunit [Gemmatimonadota bacterium]|nr:MAG: efflux RND transporter periplasmic adaptor subunit [Gemmatimonadota bacterium]